MVPRAPHIRTRWLASKITICSVDLIDLD